ncbi:MAG: hypothetical protein JSS50_02525, partial [Proteobacteria bacterium]|nr:hypothetical protein [Pseudomonadota bacterium]
MAYIFMDESKVFKSMPDKVRRRHSGVLHCKEELPKVRIKLLSLLAEIVFNGKPWHYILLDGVAYAHC